MNVVMDDLNTKMENGNTNWDLTEHVTSAAEIDKW